MHWGQFAWLINELVVKAFPINKISYIAYKIYYSSTITTPIYTCISLHFTLFYPNHFIFKKHKKIFKTLDLLSHRYSAQNSYLDKFNDKTEDNWLSLKCTYISQLKLELSIYMHQYNTGHTLCLKKTIPPNHQR